MMKEIDKLQKQLEDIENQIDNNADGDPHYLGMLMSSRDKIEEQINTIILRDF